MAGKNSDARVRMEKLSHLPDPNADVSQGSLLVDVMADKVEAFISSSLELLSRFEALQSKGLLPGDGPRIILLVRQHIEVLDAAVIQLRTGEGHPDEIGAKPRTPR